MTESQLANRLYAVSEMRRLVDDHYARCEDPEHCDLRHLIDTLSCGHRVKDQITVPPRPPHPARTKWAAVFNSLPEYGALVIEHRSTYPAKQTWRAARYFAAELGADVRVKRVDATVYLERV